MMKMIFKLNEEKIKADGKSVEEMWAKVDAAFSKDEAYSQRLADGSVEYSSNPNIEDDFNVFGGTLATLGMDKEFVPYCSKWTWTEYDDEGEYVIEEDNVLEDVKDLKYGLGVD